jgi:hypothetical protein
VQLRHLAAALQRQKPPAGVEPAPVPGPAVQRKFDPALVHANAHLRASDLATQKGPKIPAGRTILVNHAAPKTGSSDTWYPAVNAAPGDYGVAVGDDQRGFIRGKRIRPDGRDFNEMLKGMLTDILVQAEQSQPMLTEQLAKPDHVDFLFNKALKADEWNKNDVKAELFAAGFSTLLDKFRRVREGAEYLADTIEHWRKWLHPDGRTVVWNVTLLQSDLHERGLGVAKVEFRKSPGPSGHLFAADTVVNTVVKPEDKSLEEALLGASPTSAASQINQIVGLATRDEMLTTIRMRASQDHGTLVEVVKGLEAKHLSPGSHATKAVFHETLVFAFLAGLDDLHKENVFWHEGRPYLIDADNVLNRNQMEKLASGDVDQSGFSSYNRDEAAANRDAIKRGDNTGINSKILQAMLTSQPQRVQIAAVLKRAIEGRKGRIAPIASEFWGHQRDFYWSQERHREQNLTGSSSEDIMVGKVGRYDSKVGAGLIGVCGENTANRMYDQAAEKEQQRADFAAGVIPFYEYDFSTGRVTHNGRHIWNGLTVNQAIGEMLDRFDPSGVSRAAAGL